MASGLSFHHLFSVRSLHHQFRCLCYTNNPPYKASIFQQSPNCSLRLRTVPKSSPRETPTTSLEPETPTTSDNRVKAPDPGPNSLSLLIRRLREGLKVDELGLEILSIALPAALALLADPLTSLVDTAFVGHLGSVELAAVGVSVSVFNLVSKLFNVPLLNITTSFVAEEQALVAKSEDDSHQIDQGDQVADPKSKKLLPSVSTSLVLAAGIGIAEALALSVGSGLLMNTMGFTNACTGRAIYFS